MVVMVVLAVDVGCRMGNESRRSVMGECREYGNDSRSSR